MKKFLTSYLNLSFLLTAFIFSLLITDKGVSENTFINKPDFKFEKKLKDKLCSRFFPKPVVRINGGYANGSIAFYNLSISNYRYYHNKLFQPAPDLNLCEKDENASRTWVHIWNQRRKELYVICNLKKASDLQNLWFPICGDELKKTPFIRVIIWDKKCDRPFISNLIPLKPVKPKLIYPKNNEKFSNFPRTVTLKWSSVPGARSYTVEIDCFHCCKENKWCRDVGKVFHIKKALRGNTYTFEFTGAQPGRWRVWAVDKYGREGFKSEWRYFEYLR